MHRHTFINICMLYIPAIFQVISFLPPRIDKIRYLCDALWSLAKKHFVSGSSPLKFPLFCRKHLHLETGGRWSHFSPTRLYIFTFFSWSCWFHTPPTKLFLAASPGDGWLLDSSLSSHGAAALGDDGGTKPDTMLEDVGASNTECEWRIDRFMRNVGTDLDLASPSRFEDRNRFVDDLACWILLNLPTQISADTYRHQLCSRFGTSNIVVPLAFEHWKVNLILDANKCKWIGIQCTPQTSFFGWN